jgi:probable rRNA maturation factor
MVQKLVLPLPPQMVNVSYDFLEVKLDGFDSKKCTLWIKKVLSRHKVSNANLGYVFVSDEYLLKMNQEHLSHDFYTDIITFNYNEKDSLGGEMYISLDRVRDNANEFSGGDFDRELFRVIIHGVLHLIGFDDQTDEDELKIREEEEVCLSLK